MKVRTLVNVAVTALITVYSATSYAQYAVARDQDLLTRWVSPVWYKIKPSPNPVQLEESYPTPEEQEVIDRVENIIQTSPVRAFMLMDGNKIIYSKHVSPARNGDVFLGYSMGKTVTAMAVGKAICSGKLSMNTRADSLIPELQGKDLGTVTVKHLLTMSSGTVDPIYNTSYYTLEEVINVNRGNAELQGMIVRDSVSKFKRGAFSSYKPGETFLYKGSDVDTVALMVANATGMSYAEWLQESVINPAGIANSGWQGQDRKKMARAAGSTNLTLDDWARFALWVKNSSKENGCFGNFVREAMSTQIPNYTDVGKSFKGYGYYMWTENTLAKDAAWAVGYGGQRIGWDKKSDRMVIVFSSIENYMSDIYSIARAWNKLK